MVAVRLDRRLAARVDPSDVVQEALAEADRHLYDYLRDRPLPFYPWLRQFAWERLSQAASPPLEARRRSVAREEDGRRPLPDESVVQLAHRLVASGTSPSRHVIRDELRDRVRAALAELTPRDREVLVLRYLEELRRPRSAAVLGISEGAVRIAPPAGPGAAPAPAGRRRPRRTDDEIALRTSVLDRVGRRPTRSWPELVDELTDAAPGRRAGRPGGATPPSIPSTPSGCAGSLPALEVMADLGRVGRPGALRGRSTAGQLDAAAPACWATSASSARSAGAAWASSTRPSRSRSAAGWR